MSDKVSYEDLVKTIKTIEGFRQDNIHTIVEMEREKVEILKELKEIKKLVKLLLKS